MNLSKEREQRSEFQRILQELAKNQNFSEDSNARRTMYMRLENLYHSPEITEGFRHFYSDIFSILTVIKTTGDGDIDILGQNLELIRAGYKPSNHDKDGALIDISNNIRKLSDHVSLDIARIQYSEGQNRDATGEASIDNLKSQVNQVDNQIKQIVSDLEKSREQFETKMSDQQKDYIAILGIFASVVLAFVAGITFSASVLESMNGVSIYRLVLVILLLGFVLINTIHYLLDTIIKISRKGSKEHEEYTSKEELSKTGKVKKKLSWICKINWFFIICVGLLLLAWVFGAQNRVWKCWHNPPW